MPCFIIWVFKSKSQRYSVCYHSKYANLRSWNQHFFFLFFVCFLKNYSKLLIEYQSTCWLIVCLLTNWYISKYDHACSCGLLLNVSKKCLIWYYCKKKKKKLRCFCWQIRFFFLSSSQDLFSVRMSTQHWSSLKEGHVLSLHLSRYGLVQSRCSIIRPSLNVKHIPKKLNPDRPPICPVGGSP